MELDYGINKVKITNTNLDLKKKRKEICPKSIKVTPSVLRAFVENEVMEKKGRNFVQQVLCLLLCTFIFPKIGRTNMDLIFVFHIILDIQPMSF